MAITITSKYNHENCFFFWKWYELWPCISSYCANLVKWQKKDLYSNELKSSAKKLWHACESRVNTEKSARPPAGRRTTRELLRRLWMRSAGCNCESRQPTEVSWSSVKYIFTHQVSPFLQQGLSWFLNLALSLLSFWYGHEKWLQVDIARFSVCVLYPTYTYKIATMPLIWFVSAFYVLQK